MVFNSYTFFLFLLVVLGLHYLPLSWRVRKFNLVWASYVFYAAWNPPFVILLWISTVMDWYLSKWIYRLPTPAGRRRLLVLSLLVNLGLLAFFKYNAFLLDNFVATLHVFGIQFHPAAPDIILPVGISFYTFHTLSYTLDVYRGLTKPWNSFLDFALYVTFFPQLVAGPILRARSFLPQCEQPHRPTAAVFAWGMSLLVVGLFEKVVLADGLFAPVAETLYDATGKPDVLSAWMGTLAFAGQIFCDFAGYSTCAIGVAMCLGFSVPSNFKFPYAAVGFSDFWRRWHISLSTWLRDYLYIPLGGNRQGAARTQGNLMATMLIGGLWHGASWTFVAWGGLHGIYLVIERALRERLGTHAVWGRASVRMLLAAVTFVLVCVTWVFFRARTFGQAWTVLTAMAGRVAPGPTLQLATMDVIIVSITMSVLLAAHWLMRDTGLEGVTDRCPWWLRSVGLAAMIMAIICMPGEDRAFIYFQF